MLYRINTLFFILCLTFSSFSQDKIKSSDLVGKWKLNWNTENIKEALNEEKEQSESLFENVVLSSIKGAIMGLSENIQIYFIFEKEGNVKININILDNLTEVEDLEWYISNKIKLMLRDKNETDNDRDTQFSLRLDDGILYLNFDDKKDKITAFLTKID